MTDASPLILITNHDRTYLELMEELLSEEGYRVMVLYQADEFYARVLSDKPAMVIIDLPVTNPDSAWTLLNTLRLNPSTSRLPILICSANSTLIRNSVARLNAMGCAILEKPFRIEGLLGCISDLLKPSAR